MKDVYVAGRPDDDPISPDEHETLVEFADVLIAVANLLKDAKTVGETKHILEKLDDIPLPGEVQ